MTHSSTVLRRPELAGHTAAFDEWVPDAVARGDVDALIDHRRRGPGPDVSHATPEHFVPLLLTVGAGTTAGRATTSGVDGTWFDDSIRSPQVVRRVHRLSCRPPEPRPPATAVRGGGARPTRRSGASSSCSGVDGTSVQLLDAATDRP